MTGVFTCGADGPDSEKDLRRFGAGSPSIWWVD